MSLLFATMARAQQPQLAFSVQPGGVVAAALPVSILQDATVRKQLRSGLTTTFLIVARQRDTRAVTGARIEVRYDLWDEVWIAQKVELNRRGERQRLTSLDALEKWWRTPVRLLSTKASRVTVQVDLSVLPFSAAEEEDAREWISKSGGVGTEGGSGGLVDALIGTTLSAKPLTSYRWNVELALQ
ncbi:MAG TPA: hypothetical protein VEK79_14600 [Thermoanaerobaculia bacterium]|nr:hypothetical protein [Thermoanaerobaculia bacterium]